jgi:protein phosphatase
MACTAEGMTDTGLKRERNEDAFLVDDNLGLYAVADGIGGLERGAFASEMALESIQRLLADKSPPPWGFVERIKRAIRASNDLLRRVGGTYISTTLVLALIRDCTAYIANLGDSRAYLFRKGKLGESHRRL